MRKWQRIKFPLTMITSLTPPELLDLLAFAPELKDRYAKTLNMSLTDFNQKLEEGLTPEEARAILTGLRLMIAQINGAEKALDKALSGK